MFVTLVKGQGNAVLVVLNIVSLCSLCAVCAIVLPENPDLRVCLLGDQPVLIFCALNRYNCS